MQRRESSSSHYLALEITKAGGFCSTKCRSKRCRSVTEQPAHKHCFSSCWGLRMHPAQKADLPFPASCPVGAASPTQAPDVSSHAVTGTGDGSIWKLTLPEKEEEDSFSVDQQSFTSSFYNKEERGPAVSLALLAWVSKAAAMKCSCSLLHAHNRSTANQVTFPQVLHITEVFSLVKHSLACISNRLRLQRKWPKRSPAKEMVTTSFLHSKEGMTCHPVLKAWIFLYNWSIASSGWLKMMKLIEKETKQSALTQPGSGRIYSFTANEAVWEIIFR